MLVTLQEGERSFPSEYAKAATSAGLGIITWSLERSGPLKTEAGGWYYQSVADGDRRRRQDVRGCRRAGPGRRRGVGIFSDWPGTVTYYANCMGLN